MRVCLLALQGQALQGQRFWDRRYKDSGSGTCRTGTAVLGQALQGHFVFCDNFYLTVTGATGTFCFFCDMNVERKFSLRLYVI